MAKPKNVVGPQVRRIRDKHGWSQSQFAAKCQVAGWGISRGIVASIEGRVRWVADFELMLLAKVLKVGVLELLPERIDWSVVAEEE